MKRTSLSRISIYLHMGLRTV